MRPPAPRPPKRPTRHRVAHETAWRAWRDLVRDTQAAVTQYAKEQGIARHEAEADVKAKARAGEAPSEP
ncbi:hypothetical protein EOT10_16755 [Streptomyces antnestii]|uniref:Uncharacterized protein n=1 Tax=Streptomyces antnestii TaxID=2494256 RepID=A0A3S2YZQ4_9ACTN|nr:hypothetical protein [Streptomyces sp. San01]RVU23724.1 hypothetical protein EOT10_16755 [Streptomyces sp. San01]